MMSASLESKTENVHMLTPKINPSKI